MISMTCSANAGMKPGCHADPVALLDRAAHDPPQDVAAVLVGGHDAVGDEERHRARVVGEDPQRALVGLLGRQLAAERHERRERVGLEDRLDALLDDRHALEAQAGVDVVGRQRRRASCGRRRRRQVVLREDEVPVLQEALVLAARQVVGACRTPGRGRGTARCTARTARVGPACQKFSERGHRTIRSRGTPTDSHASIASSSGPMPSSSSPSKTVIQMSSGSKPKPSSDSSQANSTASCLK